MNKRYFESSTAHARRLCSDNSGALIVIFAIVLPILLLAAAVAIDYAYVFLRRSELQHAADTAALAGAKEFMLANADKDAIAALARGSVIENLEHAEGVEVTTTASSADRSVSVVATQGHQYLIMGALAGLESSGIEARATAKVAGEVPVCMLLLHPSDTAALALNNRSQITGPRCAIHANSDNSKAILASNGARLLSELTCSGGGYRGDESNFDPIPQTDCPPLDDPLAHRRSPPDQRCMEESLNLTKGKHTLQPGTYCGGLNIAGSAEVVFAPGIYVIKDGKFTIGGKADVSGKEVGFFLTGRNATFSFLPQTTIDLSAPESGPLTGILFFESRDSGPSRQHIIRSNGARSFVGTIYLPNGELVIDAAKPVFAASAYTVIIARRMTMFSGPNLILNSDYDSSDVPVPEELEDMTSHGKFVVLTE